MRKTLLHYSRCQVKKKRTYHHLRQTSLSPRPGIAKSEEINSETLSRGLRESDSAGESPDSESPPAESCIGLGLFRYYGTPGSNLSDLTAEAPALSTAHGAEEQSGTIRQPQAHRHTTFSLPLPLKTRRERLISLLMAGR